MLRIVSIETPRALAQHQANWDDLANQSVDPNVFYHSRIFLPAWETLGRDVELHVVLAYAPTAGGGEQMVGFFPFEIARIDGLFMRGVRLWKHAQCFHCAPLVRIDFATHVLKAIFQWLRAMPRRPKVLEALSFPGDGPLFAALAETLQSERRPWFARSMDSRAVLHPQGNSEAYFARHFSKSRRKKVRRSESRLANRGRVEFVAVDAAVDIDRFIDDFLRMESSGWKGAEGSALACNPTHRAFFVAAVQSAHAAGMLCARSLCLDGVPIAMICDFRLGDVIFGYKVAHNEAYADDAPGVVLEVENVRRIIDDRLASRADSCSAPGATLLKSLWNDSRLMVDLVIGIGRAPGDLAVSLLPLLRWAKRLVRPAPSPVVDESAPD